MEIITTVAEMKARVAAWKAEGLTIGLTPTMGALHEGHMSLMEAARSACDRVVTSVFVNPLQFGPDEDYDNYPRDLERDAGIAESKGVDVVFHPNVEEMYPENYNTYVVMETLTDTLCGPSRYRPVYRRRCLHHALLCGGHLGGAHIVVFVDRGDMEHVACRGRPGGGR